MGQPRHEGRCHPVTVRGFGKELPALVTPAMRPRHRSVRARFINKDKAPKVQAGLTCPPKLASQSNVWTILLSRKYRFF